MINNTKQYQPAAHNFALLVFSCALFLSVFCTSFAHAQDSGWSSPEELFEQGQEDLYAADLDDLKKELEQARLFKELEEAKHVLDSASRCGLHIREAKSSRDALEALNAQNITRTEENYGRHAREFKAKNTQALQDLKYCYSAALSGWPALQAKGIGTYDAFTTAYNDLVDFYDSIPNLPSHIKAIEDEIKRREEGIKPESLTDIEVVAVLAYVHKAVEVLPGGRGKRWKKISRGYKLRINDELRTGSKSRARLVFTDRYNQDNAGPTVLNVGSDSHIKIKHFAKNMLKKPEPTIIDLLRGSLRAFTKGLSFANEFRVTTGASICGIRGTEVAISYNPDTDSVGYHLDHGNAYIENKGEKIQLAPSTARVITNGVISAELPRSSADWNQVVKSTGEGHAESQTSIIEAYNSLFTPKDEIEPVAPANTLGSAADEDASFTVSDFLNALKNSDVATVRLLTTESVSHRLAEHSAADYKEMLDKNGQRPRDFTIKCTLCKENLCQVLVYIDAEKNLPGQGADYLFNIVRETSASMWKINQSTADKNEIADFRLKPAICKN